MEKMPQNFANHAKTDPKYHWFLMPVVVIDVVWALWRLVMMPYDLSFRIWGVVMAAALAVLVFTVRVYALRVQDRVIRLEERLRMMSLLPNELKPRIWELKEPQLIALRFASDEELAGLVEKTLASNLDPKSIKRSIQVWRPDYYRV